VTVDGQCREGAAGTTAEPLFTDSKGRPVALPQLGAPVADTHAHLDMLEDPARALARAARAGVGFIATVADVTEDAVRTYAELDRWVQEAGEMLAEHAPPRGGHAQGEDTLGAHAPSRGGHAQGEDTLGAHALGDAPPVPRIRVIVGAHPHNAKDYDAGAERELRAFLADPLTCALGEAGLDYHYDHSPRQVQRDRFQRHLELAHEFALPVVLHLREAHDDGLEILRSVGMPEAGAILHCYTLGPEQMLPFLELGCHVAFGGLVTFKKAEDIRLAAAAAPLDRVLTETDCPFMAPEPFRGRRGEPALVAFTAAALARVRPEPAEGFLESAYSSAIRLLDRTRL